MSLLQDGDLKISGREFDLNINECCTIELNCNRTLLSLIVKNYKENPKKLIKDIKNEYPSFADQIIRDIKRS